jgi:hypothetical protein
MSSTSDYEDDASDATDDEAVGPEDGALVVLAGDDGDGLEAMQHALSDGTEASGPVASIGVPDTTDDVKAALDHLTCPHCGSVICVDGADDKTTEDSNNMASTATTKARAAAKAATTTKRPKVKVTPGMMRVPTLRIATRVAMLCAIPSMTKKRATRLLQVYPTLKALRNAPPQQLALVPVGKTVTLGEDLATAVHQVLQ